MWAIHAAADGRLWYGGDLTHIGARRLSGFGRLSVADTVPPTVPGELTATSVLDDAVTLSWTASTDDRGLRHYAVLRDGIQVATTDSTTFVDTTVAPDTVYGYEVEAIDEQSNRSGPSSLLSVTTQPTIVLTDLIEPGAIWSIWTTGPTRRTPGASRRSTTAHGRAARPSSVTAMATR